MSFVESDGCRIYYERHGAGPAIMLLHGAGSNAATWWQQIPALSRRYTCISLDYRCFGRSEATAQSLNWDALARDALAVLDAESIERAALVCQSLGGGIGLRLALSHPERVWALVSCGSPLGIDSPAIVERVEQHLRHAEGGQVEQRALAPQFLESQKTLSFLYQQINSFNPMVFGGTENELKMRLRCLITSEVLIRSERLKDVTCPVLLISGEHDPLVPPALATVLAAYFANARTLTMGGCGHSPYFERPDEFNHSIEDFLARSALPPEPPLQTL